MLNNIRIEKIILAPILPKTFFWGFSSTSCYTLSQATIWAISGKTNDGTLRKWQKPYPNFEPNLGPQIFFLGFYLDYVPNYHPMQYPGKLIN